MSQYKSNPKKAGVISPNTESAWWYANDKSIDIFMQHCGGSVVSCRIPRSALVKFIEHTNPSLRTSEEYKV